MEQTFTRENVSVMIKVHKNMISDREFIVGTEGDDFIEGLLTAQLTGFIYSSLVEKRELVYYFKRPSFLDWLLRRERTAVFELVVKDLLLDTPQPGTVRSYRERMIDNNQPNH